MLLTSYTLLGSDITAGFVNLQTGTLAQGSHTLTATVTDAAGNPSAASNSFTVIEDTTLPAAPTITSDRKSTRLNSSHSATSYAVICLKKKTGTVTLNGSGAT